MAYTNVIAQRIEAATLLIALEREPDRAKYDEFIASFVRFGLKPSDIGATRERLDRLDKLIPRS